MRETVARALCFFTVGAALVLALVFASRHNARREVAPATPPDRVKPEMRVAAGASPPTPSVERGRQVFEGALCVSCHSVGERGNPRYPLDGVGERRPADELKEWITGSGSAATHLPASVKRRKQRYRDLPGEDMDALVVYLSAGAPGTRAKPRE